MSLVAWILWNSGEGRLRTLWRLVVAVAALAVFGGVVAAAQSRLRIPTSISPLMQLATGIGMLGVIAAVCRSVDRRRFSSLGLRMNRRWWIELAIGFAIGGGMLTGVFAVSVLAGWTRVTGRFAVDDALGSLPLAIATALTSHILTAVLEEIVLRAYPLRNLAEGLRGPLGGGLRSTLAAWLITGVGFGVLHAGNPNASVAATLNVAGAGLLLGLGYVLTGQLALPIGLHLGWNLFEGSVFGFPVSGHAAPMTVLATETDGPTIWTGGAFGPEAGILCTASMVLGAAAVAWVSPGRSGRVCVRTELADFERDSLAPGKS